MYVSSRVSACGRVCACESPHVLMSLCAVQRYLETHLRLDPSDLIFSAFMSNALVEIEQFLRVKKKERTVRELTTLTECSCSYSITYLETLIIVIV